MNLLLSSIAAAVPTIPVLPTKPTCNEVLSACDLAVRALERDVTAKDTLILQQQREIGVAKQALEDANAALGHFWRNPFTMVAVGLVIGVWAAKR